MKIEAKKTLEGKELQQNPPVLEVKNKSMCIFENNIGQKIPFDEDLLSQHLMFIGGIGTGKTNAIYQIVEQIRDSMEINDIMIIFDAKGDYRKLKRDGDVIISNDDTCVGLDDKKDYWNIFNEIERDNRMEENIIEISKTLFSEKIEKTQQPFFPLAAKDLFSALLFHCCRDENNKKFHNGDLSHFWQSTEDVKLILKMLELHPNLKAMKYYIGKGESSQALGVLAELQELVRDIFIGNFAKEGTLSMRQLVRAKGGRIIFIEYDIGIGKALSPIYSLLFDLAIKEALCRTKSEGSVYFIADEFKLLPHLQHIDDAVNFGRSLGVKFLIGIQNVEQVYEAYNTGKGDERARSLLSGFSTTVCFRLNDKESRDYIQGRYGKSRKGESFYSGIPNQPAEVKINEANVVEDWDILKLERGQAIIGLPEPKLNPFLFQFKKYELKNTA